MGSDLEILQLHFRVFAVQQIVRYLIAGPTNIVRHCRITTARKLKRLLLFGYPYLIFTQPAEVRVKEGVVVVAVLSNKRL